MISVRRARLEDAAGINAVYNPYILESSATFELAPHTEERRRAHLQRLEQSGHPVFVATETEDGAVVGFANAAPFDPRPGYASSVKTSVFVAGSAAGRGAGRALYKALFDALPDRPFHRAYALIVAPNPASVRLHEAFGFRHVGTLSEVGRKLGAFHDVMWFEKRLRESAPAPSTAPDSLL